MAVCLGQFLIQLDLSAVNVALPAVGANLHAGTSTLQWVLDGYNLAVASLLLLGGRLGDRAGHKRTYLTGLALFALGSVLCAAAPGAGWLVGCRVLQGVGAAIELPATLAILTHTFPHPVERGQAVGIWAGAAGFSLVVGPVLGGGVVATFGWRAVFLLNVPVVAASGTLVALAVTGERGGGEGGIDCPGQLAGAAGLALLAAAAIEGGRLGFTGVLALGLFAGGAACLAAFVAIEHRRTAPMLPLGYFRLPAYSAANADGVVMGFVTIGLLFLLSLLFEQVQRASAVDAGLRLLPLTAAFVVTGPTVGRLIRRIGHGVPMATGCGLLALGCLLLARLGAAAGYGSLWWPLAMLGVGYGLLSTPMAAVVLDAVPPERAGMASSTNLTARLVGGVLGVAVLGALLPSGPRSPAAPRAFVAGMHDALLVAAAVAAAGALLAVACIRRAGPTRPAPAAGQARRCGGLDR